MSFPLEDMLSKKSLTITKRGMTSFRTGKKQVETNAVEICAETEPLSERTRMIVMSEGEVYIGNVGVTVETGFVLLPGYENRMEFEFDPRSPVSIYAIAKEPTYIYVWEEA